MAATVTEDLQLLDAQLDDAVVCERTGCSELAVWRCHCADCDNATVLICGLHALTFRDKLRSDEYRGIVIQCHRTNRIGRPLEMILFHLLS